LTGAVTFDYGQTICEIDLDMLARRVSERGASLNPASAKQNEAAAWKTYNDAKAAGRSHEDGWLSFMSTLLRGGGVAESELDALSRWLWSEQPAKNLWRKPIDGMLELIGDLHDAGVPLAVISNSEGKLVELCDEIGLTPFFSVFVDSGVVGLEKPDRRIFELTAERLGVRLEDIIHIGDAWVADVMGAIEAGARAVYFSPEERELPERVARASNALELRRTLTRWGVAGIGEHRG